MDACPLWYKDAIIYELHVRAFADDNGDGMGDFRGLTQKLDYLQDLGVTAIWILPFYPSPLKDDGYDTADYMSVHQNYGTLRDFKLFLREAHRRGLRVITELVLNHTSDQHPWFQRARRAPPGSNWRNFYVWSDDPDKYSDARIIFKDFEHSNWSWDPVAKAYYWHRFYHHQPDLNYENPEVRQAMLHVVDHWLGMGVDGLRLDAVPYLLEREGTNCENLPETHDALKELRAHIDENFPGRMLLAEANQWPEDAVAYFGDGDECHTAFHFPVMPRLFMSLQMEDRFPIIDILQQTPAIPESCQWVLFLRNHDELTLEMVTDEERDYMYRMYARDNQARINLGIRRRLAPLLGNARRKIELLNGLLMSLPGTPVIYYGDEIGMGDNIYLGDRNGVRTPMQWTADRNAGFARVNPQQLYLPVIIDHEYHYEAVNVETQRKNPHSLLWWMKRLIGLRQQYRAFGRGTLEFLYPHNPKVLAFVRQYEDESILVVANLSRFAQYVELDLSEFRGSTPVELFGHTDFPPIGGLPYLLTLGPHAFYWFSIRAAREQLPEGSDAHGGVTTAAETLPRLETTGEWDHVLRGSTRGVLESLLPDLLRRRRWFGGKARVMRGVTILDAISMEQASQSPRVNVLFLRVDYVEGDPETYVLPLGFASGDRAQWMLTDAPPSLVARLDVKTSRDTESGVLYDAFGDEAFSQALLELIASRRRLAGKAGRLIGKPSRSFKNIRGDVAEPLTSTPLKVEQSNSSVIYGDRMLLKLFRRAEEGVNPDLEIGRFLTETVPFPHIAPVAGALEYERDREETITLAVMQGLVRNEGDAWQFTLDVAGRFFERVLSESANVKFTENLLPQRPLTALVDSEPPALAEDMCGSYLDAAELLGRRTAQLHLALASNRDNPTFAPEPFSELYQRSLYQGMRSLAGRTFRLLRGRLGDLPDDVRADAEQVLDREREIYDRFQTISTRKIPAMRIRCHGDYHLGQVLYTGKDFVIIDFEGEPARPISERRIKRSPLRDVAGMLRSFAYASYTSMNEQTGKFVVAPENQPLLEQWAQFWTLWTSTAFLKSYLVVADTASFIPPARDDVQTLLDVYLLEKAVYELGYELNNRPDWARIPLHGILRMLRTTV